MALCKVNILKVLPLSLLDTLLDLLPATPLLADQLLPREGPILDMIIRPS